MFNFKAAFVPLLAFILFFQSDIISGSCEVKYNYTDKMNGESFLSFNIYIIIVTTLNS